MDSFDIMTTATLRPDLIKKTFNSHIENLFENNIKKANLIINIDPIGSSNIHKELHTILTYLDSIPFKSITMRTPAIKPSFSMAFYWCLGQLSSQYTFNLEEDWELTQHFDFHEMVNLFENDNNLAHLRLSAFKSDGSGKLKNWNKFLNWTGKYYSVPRNLRGTIGWCGHPSLNKTSFLMFFRTIIDPTSNPEKQIKGAYPIILNSKFGVFHSRWKSPAAIKDIGRDWMKENGFKKKGIKAFFTEWEKIGENNGK